MDLLLTSSTSSEFPYSSSDGCQYVDDGKICGEKDSLAIIGEMQKLYEEKMSILDKEGGGDFEALQAKNRLQEMWIKDLIQQSKMLVAAIQELEREATDRVRLLEERIKKSSLSGSEVMNRYKDLDLIFSINENFQNVLNLRSDVNNFINVLRQFQNDGVWSIKQLQFFHVNSDEFVYLEDSVRKNFVEPVEKNFGEKFKALKNQLDEKNCKIKSLELLIERLTTQTETKSCNGIEELKQQMIEMKTDFTTETNEKQANISSLRHDFNKLEEHCKQIKEEVIIKDEIIQELREEIKKFHNECKSADAEERKRLEEDINRYQGQKYNLNALIENLTKDCKDPDQKNLNKEVIESLTHQIQILQAQKQEISNNFQNLNRSNGDCISLADHEKIKKEITEQLRREYLDEIQSLKKEKLYYLEKYEAGLAEIERTEREKEKREDNIRELGCAIKECEQYQKKYEKGLAQIENMSKEKKEYEMKIKELEVSMKAYEECKLQFSEGLKRIENLRQKVSELTTEFHEELRSSGINDIINTEFNEQKELIKKKVAEAVEANNKFEEQTLRNLEEKMLEICMLKNQIKILEGKDLTKGESLDSLCLTKSEREMKDKEITNLKNCIKQLEEGQTNAKLAVESLQSMVGSYRKSISILRETEKKLKSEISQQNITIQNLQEALITTKKELEEFRQNASKEISFNMELINSLYSDLLATEENYLINNQQNQKCIKLLNDLKGEYLDLQVENFNCRQDVEMLDSLVLKYQQCHRFSEQTMKDAIRIMRAEKEEYENIIGYLKNEMGVLSGQLFKLQQLLKQANSSNLDFENQALEGSLIDAEAVNRVLQEQLNVSETQLAYEMKMNKHYISLIEEVQDKLSSETVKNHRLQQKVLELQQQLDKSKSKIMCLENMLNELENTILIYEKDKTIIEAQERQVQDEVQHYKIQLCETTEKYEKLNAKYHDLEKELENTSEAMKAKEKKIKKEYEDREKTKLDLSAKLDYAKQELGNLKNEMNKTLSMQGSLRGDNEKLKAQILNLKSERNALKEELLNRAQELEQYTIELQTIQEEKEIVHEKYTKLKMELQGLQTAFDNLSKQVINKTESLISLEIELVDTKSSHTQLCKESKKVVDNVRGWLEEQKDINCKLARTIREKDEVISKLRGEVKNLRCHLTLPHKFVPSVNKQQKDYVLLPTSPFMQAFNSPQPWSLGSEESESSYNSNNNANEAEEDTYTSDYDTNTESWLYRVESMTEKLRKTNNFWKTTINDNELMVSKDQ